MIFIVLEIKWLAVNDTPFSSSKTTWSISATSSWVLKPKGTSLMLDSLHFKAHRKLGGSTGFVEFFFTAMLRLIAGNIGHKVCDSRGTLLPRVSITLQDRIDVTVVTLLMNSTGRIDFAFATGLVGCLRDGIEDVELQVPSKDSLSLKLEAEGVQSLLYYGEPGF